MTEHTPASSPTEHTAADRETLAAALARDITALLADQLREQARTSLVVSGGSTPIPLFHALRTAELPWNRVDVTLADERWVPPHHEDSNERLVRGHLLQGPAAEARFVPLFSDADTPEEGQEDCENRLRGIRRPFGVTVLGMGGDGHTASLFPDTPCLAGGLDPDTGATCIATHPGTAPHPRMSLTLAALLDTRRVILHITGNDKWNVYREALAGGDARALPIRAVLHQRRVPVDVYWAP